ncbi:MULTISPECIES: hypothetical protein [Nocardia]|uniref:Uncharacterized protein n=1 Tax=Nocardia nova TaxID=37330 RepID=A0A2T2Z8G3_9NOCA|nr:MULTISPECIES: hypothetical protein [Nocardia]PSR64019.1 hypothetical protein C8259_09240 [Nocardia nova]
MTAVEPVPTTPPAPLDIADSERREFALGHTHTLSRDALVVAFRQAAEDGLRDYPDNPSFALAAAWGTLLGGLGISEEAGVRPW